MQGVFWLVSLPLLGRICWPQILQHGPYSRLYFNDCSVGQPFGRLLGQSGIMTQPTALTFFSGQHSDVTHSAGPDAGHASAGISVMLAMLRMLASAFAA